MNPGDMNQLHATRGDYPAPRKAIVTIALIAVAGTALVALQPYIQAACVWIEAALP